MTKENRRLMQLLKAHLTQGKAEALPGVDWHTVIETAERQNILAIAGDKILELKDTVFQSPEESKQLYLKIMKQLYLMNKKEERAARMFKLLKENNIKTVALKGAAIRDLYPVPQWRTMGDIDVLVSPKDMDKIKVLFSENGYKVSGTAEREWDCYKDKNLPWEIKCSLEAEYKDSYEHWNGIYYSNVQQWKHGQYKPINTLIFQHILLHTATNLVTLGAGVRNLCDIALCMSNMPDIDYEAVKKVLEDEGYMKAYNAIINCVNYWFDVNVSNTGAEKIKDENIEAITDYMLSETIYGKRSPDNRLTHWTLRKDDISPWRKIFFPSVKIMKMPYPYLKKYPLLLPIAWIQRAFNAIVTQKIPVSNMIKGMKESVDYANEHDKLMNELGLK